MVLGGAPDVPYAVPRAAVLDADRTGVRLHLGPEPGDHLLDSLGRTALHVHEHQHHDVPQALAGRLDPSWLHAPVPPGTRVVAADPLRDHAVRNLPGVWHAADCDGGLLHHRVALVPLLPLQVRAPRRPVHDAVAEAEDALNWI